ncbi:MAG: hypothetical protein WHT08_05885 [Bryobacteraceae bacterium]
MGRGPGMTEQAPERREPESAEALAQALCAWLLRPGLADASLHAECRAAAAAGLGAVAVFPADAERALRVLEGSGTAVIAVAGYPHGASTTAAKLYEARDLLRRGVREIGFVLNAAQLISREFQQVETELMQIGRSCAESGARLHAMVEAGLLAEDLRVIATKICKRCDAGVLSLLPGAAGAAADLSGLDLFCRIAREEILIGVCANRLTLDEVLDAWRRGARRFGAENAVELASAWRARCEAEADSSGEEARRV